MNYVPIDVMTTPVQSGGGYPEGWYLLEITDATEVKLEKNNEHKRRNYKSKIVRGPGWSQEFAGKKFTDGLREHKDWAGRHMELFAAAMGSVENVRATAQAHGGHFPAEALHGRAYIVQLTKNGQYVNVSVRLPYTEEIWNENVGSSMAAPTGMLGGQQMATPAVAAPAYAPAPTAAPGYPAAAPAPAPAPAPAYAPAPAPAPAYAPAPAPAPVVTAPPMPAPAPAAGVPTPPPPPGAPAAG